MSAFRDKVLARLREDFPNHAFEWKEHQTAQAGDRIETARGGITNYGPAPITVISLLVDGEPLRSKKQGRVIVGERDLLQDYADSVLVHLSRKRYEGQFGKPWDEVVRLGQEQQSRWDRELKRAHLFAKEMREAQEHGIRDPSLLRYLYKWWIPWALENLERAVLTMLDIDREPPYRKALSWADDLEG